MGTWREEGGWGVVGGIHRYHDGRVGVRGYGGVGVWPCRRVRMHIYIHTNW